MPGFWRLRWGRARPSRVLDLPIGKPEAVADFDVPPPLERRDWPRIPSDHPNWWQVHRVVRQGTERDFVLIAEVRTETEAFKVAAMQVSQVRIRKWGVKVDYYSPEPIDRR